MNSRKPCAKPHIEEIGTYAVSNGFIKYQNADGNVFIDAYSIFQMLKSMGLKDQALAFMDRIADIRKKS